MPLSLHNFAHALMRTWEGLQYLRRKDRIPAISITHYLPSNPIMLDACAHDCTNTLRVASLWPEAQLHAFEPVQLAYDTWLARAAEYPARIHCYPLGLGRRRGRMAMHVSGDGSARSSKASSLFYDGMLAQVLVLVLTIYFASRLSG